MAGRRTQTVYLLYICLLSLAGTPAHAAGPYLSTFSRGWQFQPFTGPSSGNVNFFQAPNMNPAFTGSGPTDSLIRQSIAHWQGVKADIMAQRARLARIRELQQEDLTKLKNEQATLQADPATRNGARHQAVNREIAELNQKMSDAQTLDDILKSNQQIAENQLGQSQLALNRLQSGGCGGGGGGGGAGALIAGLLAGGAIGAAIGAAVASNNNDKPKPTPQPSSAKYENAEASNAQEIRSAIEKELAEPRLLGSTWANGYGPAGAGPTGPPSVIVISSIDSSQLDRNFGNRPSSPTYGLTLDEAGAGGAPVRCFNGGSYRVPCLMAHEINRGISANTAAADLPVRCYDAQNRSVPCPRRRRN